MKLYKCILLSFIISSSLFSQDIMPEKASNSTTQVKRLTPEELEVEKAKFVSFITKYRQNEFVGHTQYVLSALNLSIRANASYKIEKTDNTILFQLATAGGSGLTASDVTFPMQGLVYFEIKDTNGLPMDFRTEEGEIINFVGTKNTFYIVEKEVAFKLRKNVQSKFNKAEKPIGRFLAIVNYDLFSQNIEFYEIQNSPEGKTLLRRGSFNANQAPVRRGW